MGLGLGVGLTAALAAIAASGPPLAAPAVFLDRTRAAGIDYRNVTGTRHKSYIVETVGPGAGWLDYDVDGRIDLYVTDGAPLEELDDGRLRPGPGRPNVLYRNVDGARFEPAGAGVEDRGWAGGCAVADFDNDGFPDLYVTNLGRNVLYRNLGDGTFREITGAADGPQPRWSTSAAFADLDADGFLDLYVANYVEFDWDRPPRPGSSPNCSFLGVPVMCGPRGLPGAPDRLFRNDRGLRLVPWQEESVARPRLYGLGVAPLDADLDGDADLYVANDSVPNLLWRNDAGRLVEVGLEAGVAVSGDGQEQAGMGVDAADPDDDGDPDLFVTNFSHDRNTFYENVGGRFVDSTYRRGLAAASLPALGWGTEFSDVDGDADLDLLTFNGHVYPEVDEHDLGSSYLQPPQLFVNDGTGHFRPHEPLVDGEPAPPWSSRAAAFGDYDDDGDDDVFVANLDSVPALLENAGGPGPGAWLRVRLVGRGANRDAAGSRVTLLTGDGERRARWVSRAGSFQSSDDPRLGFALPGDGAVPCGAEGCALEIVWPGGGVERVEEVRAGTWIVVAQGRGVVAARSLRGAGTAVKPTRGR